MEQQRAKIKEILERLAQAGFLDRMAGNCVGATDLLQNLLFQSGINSKIVEVQLTITKQVTQGLPEYTFIGYDNLSFKGHLDTHVVLITETKTPLLIDFSIAHALNTEQQKYIVTEVLTDNEYLADVKIDRTQLVYQTKKLSRFPLLHQKTLLDRIKIEEHTQSSLKWLKTFVLAACALSLINFTLNMILIVLKMLYL